jgi:hypothetical protein
LICYQSVYIDLFGLANTMSSVHGLEVNLWVPI